MLYVIGLGLYDEQDITLRGLNAIRISQRIYLEAYTSILGVDKNKLEALYGKEVIVADRDMVETESDSILESAKEADVSFLVVGDPLGATTHADLILRAQALAIPVSIIHNASVMNAIGACGLALYNYGQAISIPFFTDSWRPDSWLERIRENWRLGLHTLCLLDIKVKEQSEENLARGRKIFEPPRFMSTIVALKQLLILLSDDESEMPADRTLIISASRLGAPNQTLVAGTIRELSALEPEVFGAPLHSFVLVGKRLHQIERDFAARFAVDRMSWLRTCNEVYGVRD